MKDEEIIERLFCREDAVLEKIASLYGRLIESVLRGILHDKSDVEECANDVLWAVWNSIPPNRPERLSSYLCTLAKRIGIDRIRHNACQKRNPGFTVLLSELEECIAEDSEPSVAEDGDAEIRDTLDRFLRELDRETRILFLRRYVYAESVSDLSARFGIRENTICVKLSRARAKLKRFLMNEGIRR